MVNKAALITLGCPKNQVDSEIMLGFLGQKFVVTHKLEEADVIVVNTCTFIEEAKEESIKTILEMSRFKEDGSCKVLIASGCMAQRYASEIMDEIPELDGVLGTDDITDINKIVEDSLEKRTAIISTLQSGFIYDEKMPRTRLSPDYSAYVKVAEGCENHCTYCVIPQVRGRFRSRDEKSIIEEAKAMAEQGVKELIIIAQDTTRYGLDRYSELRLPHLLKELAKIEGVEWIRLMYCYPELFTDELIDTMVQEPKICRYVDLPLQHADNKVLSEMNRKGTAEKAKKLIEKLRTAMPDITIRTTMIAGFPGETDTEFENLLLFIKRIEFDRLGVFAYSQEEGTPAGRRKDQIPIEVRERRREQAMMLQQDIALRRQQRWIGKLRRVIVEEKLPDGRWVGRTEGDAPEIDGQIYFTSRQELQAGDFVKVKILQVDSYDLVGEVVL